jgi:hypothetical protein
MRIEVHIEELILEGFSPADRWPVGAAVQEELIRLFTKNGVPSDWVVRGQIDSLRGDAGTITPGSRPEPNGVRLARAIYGGTAEK